MPESDSLSASQSAIDLARELMQKGRPDSDVRDALVNQGLSPALSMKVIHSLKDEVRFFRKNLGKRNIKNGILLLLGGIVLFFYTVFGLNEWSIYLISALLFVAGIVVIIKGVNELGE